MKLKAHEHGGRMSQMVLMRALDHIRWDVFDDEISSYTYIQL